MHSGGLANTEYTPRVELRENTLGRASNPCIHGWSSNKRKCVVYVFDEVEVKFEALVDDRTPVLPFETKKRTNGG